VRDFKTGDHIIRVGENNAPCHYTGEIYEFIRYVSGNMLSTRKIKGHDYKAPRDCCHSDCQGLIHYFKYVKPLVTKYLDDELFEID